MNTYTYWDNRNKNKRKKLLTCQAQNIEEADRLFLKKFPGLEPEKCPWIGCQILKNKQRD